MRSLVVAFVAAASLCPVFAQAPAATKADPPAAQAPPPPPNPNVAPVPPVLSELEHVKMENLGLRMALLQQEEQSLPQRRADIENAYGTLIRQIEVEHPGYVFNPQANGLVPAPAVRQSTPKPEAAKK